MKRPAGQPLPKRLLTEAEQREKASIEDELDKFCGHWRVPFQRYPRDFQEKSYDEQARYKWLLKRLDLIINGKSHWQIKIITHPRTKRPLAVPMRPGHGVVHAIPEGLGVRVVTKKQAPKQA